MPDENILQIFGGVEGSCFYFDEAIWAILSYRQYHGITWKESCVDASNTPRYRQLQQMFRRRPWIRTILKLNSATYFALILSHDTERPPSTEGNRPCASHDYSKAPGCRLAN